MDKQSLEQRSSSDDEPKIPLWKQIWTFIRANWLAFAFALCITLLTIIVVPIVYSLQQPDNENNNGTLDWNKNGTTILSQANLLDNKIKNPLGNISSIIFDDENNLYVVDQTNHRILKYNLNEKNLNLVIGNENGTTGTDDNSLNYPNDIIISSSKLYIADTNNHRILSWDIQNKQGFTIHGITGQNGSGINQLNQPMALTIDEENNIIYIADYGNDRIVLYNLTSNQSQILITPNYNPDADRQTFVLTPGSIKYDKDDHSLVIAQQMGYNVIRWPLNSNTNRWTLVAGSASSDLSGTSRTLFNALCHIAISSPQATYVADCNNQRIQLYQGDLTKGTTIAGVIQAPGNNSFIFNYSTAIAFDSYRNLYISDLNNFRVQQFFRI